MNVNDSERRFDTVVIGGGQAGLAVGSYLAIQGRDFVILDAHHRIGTSWHERWDRLRLFIPVWISSLSEMPLSAPADAFLTKDEVADYLEANATRFHLPVRLNTIVDTLTRKGDHYLLTVGDQQLAAEHVVVATGSYQQPRIPAFASELDPTIIQFHSDEYRNPKQLQEGDVLVVGAGNSGAEIALELVPTRRVWLAGRDPGHRPKNIPAIFRQLYWWLLHKAINADSRIGRHFKEQAEKGGAPLIGIPKNAFERAGVERISRMMGVQDGKPLLQDGRVLSVANVIWCTGFAPDFLGLPFQYTLTSSFIGGVGRDARYIAEQIAARSPVRVVHAKPAATLPV